MSLINCPSCGKLHSGHGLCRECHEKEEKEFQAVGTYIREHPGRALEEIAATTGIDKLKILQFLKQGRMQVAKPVHALLCENCRKPIKSGRYCEECALQMDKKSIKTLRKTGALHPHHGAHGHKKR